MAIVIAADRDRGEPQRLGLQQGGPGAAHAFVSELDIDGPAAGKLERRREIDREHAQLRLSLGLGEADAVRSEFAFRLRRLPDQRRLLRRSRGRPEARSDQGGDLSEPADFLGRIDRAAIIATGQGKRIPTPEKASSANNGGIGCAARAIRAGLDRPPEILRALSDTSSNNSPQSQSRQARGRRFFGTETTTNKAEPGSKVGKTPISEGRPRIFRPWILD